MVALLAQKAEVNYDQSITDIVKVVNYVTELGYHATVLEDNAQGFSVVELAVSITIHSLPIEWVSTIFIWQTNSQCFCTLAYAMPNSFPYFIMLTYAYISCTYWC